MKRNLNTQPDAILELVASNMGMAELKDMSRVSQALHKSSECSRNRRLLKTQKQQWSMLYPKMGESFARNENFLKPFGVYTQAWKEGEEAAWLAALSSLNKPRKRLSDKVKSEMRETIIKAYAPRYYTCSREYYVSSREDSKQEMWYVTASDQDVSEEIILDRIKFRSWLTPNEAIKTEIKDGIVKMRLNTRKRSLLTDAGLLPLNLLFKWCNFKEMLEIFAIVGPLTTINDLIKFIKDLNDDIFHDMVSTLSRNEIYLFCILVIARLFYLNGHKAIFKFIQEGKYNLIIIHISLVFFSKVSLHIIKQIVGNATFNFVDANIVFALQLQLVYDSFTPNMITPEILDSVARTLIKVIVYSTPDPISGILTTNSYIKSFIGAHTKILENVPVVKALYEGLLKSKEENGTNAVWVPNVDVLINKIVP